MKRSRLAAILALLLAWVCFFSLPVVAELPWDADSEDGGNNGGGADGGTNADTTVTDNANDPLTSDGGTGLPPWLWSLMSRSVSPLVAYYMLGSGAVDGDPDATGEVAEGSSTRDLQRSVRE